jgi:hypothetical protein
MWVGRAAVLFVGLAVILALVFGAATTALAHSGVDTKLFHLGHSNTSNAITKLVGSVAGPMLRLDNNSTGTGATALDLQVEPGKPPMTVNSGTKVTNLNSDKLDGIDSTSFIQGKGNIYHGRLNAPRNATRLDVLNVPGFGKVTGTCLPSDQTSYQLEWINTTGQTQEAWWFNKDGVGYQNTDVNEPSALITFSAADYVVILQVGSQGRTATITATGHPMSTGCNFSAQAVAQID